MTTLNVIRPTEALLTSAEHQLRNSDNLEPAIGLLHDRLNDLRAELSADDWTELKHQFARHSIRPLLHASPFTRRAFEKPRGYAGDAVMLDYVYQREPGPTGLSAFGQRLFQWEMGSSSCRSVRGRRDMLAEVVDNTAARISAPRILSVACGHLREAQESTAVREGRIGEYVAFDQDGQSLALIQHEQGHRGIRTVQGSVREVLKGDAAFPNMDLIYSAGLYDYLNLRTAQRLTSLLFSMLNATGTLLIANFAPTQPDIGYMEVCMGWELIYRDESAMLDLAAEIPWDAGRRLFRDDENNIVFLELTRG